MKKLRYKAELFFYPVPSLINMKHPENVSFQRKTELLNYLKSFVSGNKNRLFSKIISERTKHITIVLEDIFQPHNASAVLRSCDCFGIQDIHIIENRNKYNINPDVALGSSKWLNMINYNNDEHNTLDCISGLKEQGYRIIAATPHEDGQRLQDISVDKKMALLFGTELEGLSEIALKNADEFLYIPMYGFTECLNISVSVAVVMYQLTEKLRNLNINWHLSEEEVVDVQLDWARSAVKDSYLIEKKFFSRF